MEQYYIDLPGRGKKTELMGTLWAGEAGAGEGEISWGEGKCGDR